tara:strand:- start:1340 stop:2533 length:1194 start_codon:yes stop_codon:yes gene_type:complete
MNYSFQFDELNKLVGVEKYISHMDKWYSTLNKLFILSIEGNTGIGKSTLAELFLKDKNYNIIYFDISIIKSKNNIYDRINKSFRSYDICSILNNKKQKTAYIIDNIESNVFSKSDINELYNLFIKNNTIRPVILIGNYNKTTNFPKKKINTMKMYNPTETTLVNIGKLYINKYNYSINDINLKILVNSCQSDIKKLLVLIEQYKTHKTIKKNNIVIKNCNYNLFTDFSNLMNNYKAIDNTNVCNDQVILLTYTFHQNIYNFCIDNCKKHIENSLFTYNHFIYKSLEYEEHITKNQNWDFVNYLYFIGPKNISYLYNKNKINKNITKQIDYPKYCYLTNQKNIYKKLIQLFKKYDFYECLTEDNFKLFVQSLFNNKDKNSDIFSDLKKDEIESLSKII